LRLALLNPCMVSPTLLRLQRNKQVVQLSYAGCPHRLTWNIMFLIRKTFGNILKDQN
jgi:hypothetical protein